MKPDREALARIHDALRRGEREIDLGAALGVPFVIVQDSDGRIEVRGTEGEAPPRLRSQVWDPTPTRPADYPAGVPFVPDTRAAVVIDSDGVARGIQWYDPPEPLARLALIVEESLAEGWELQSPPPAVAERPGEHRWLVRGDRVRFLALLGAGSGRSLLALTQMERESHAD